MRRSWSELEEGSRLGLGVWTLLACPLLGAGAALDSRAAPLSLNDLPSLLLFLFGVPVVLVLATAAFARLSAETTLALVGAAIGVTVVWGLVIAALVGSVAS